MSTPLRFRLMFLGAVFAFLSIRIDNFDILPDVVGYVLLVIGCGGFSGRFAVARICWAVLAVLVVVPAWCLVPWSTEFGYLVQAMQLGGLWFLLGGMIALATNARRTDLVRSLTRRRTAFAILSLLTALYPIVLADPLEGTHGTLLFVAGMGLLLTVLMILHIIARVGRELAAEVPDNPALSVWFPMLTILAAGALGIFFFTQHSGYRSTTFSGANFHAKSEEECKRVDADLQTWFGEKGFTDPYQPTPMDQFAGMHNAESRDYWLKSDKEEFKGIYLRVSRSPKAIFISTKWEHEGFKGGEIRTERKAYELSLELARWFQARPERVVFSPDSDATGIRYFEESLAKLPAD